MNNENKIRGGDGTKTKEITTIMLTLLLVSMLSMAFNVAPAAAASSRGIVGLWHFDEGTGTDAYDSSRYNNHGTLTNMDPATAWVDGMFGKALSFDGVDDYVEVASASSIMPGILTVEAWIKPEKTGARQSLVSKWDGDADASYSLELTSDDKFLLYLHDGTTTQSITGTTVITVGTWYHVAGTYNGTYARLYVNGVLEAGPTQLVAPMTTSSVPLKIGASSYGPPDYDPYAPFEGVIDEVCIWNVALTPKQIEARYTALELKAEINALIAGDFKKTKLAEQRKKTLCNKINAVIHQIEAGAYKGAIKKLEKDIRPKLDATKRSWVVAPKPEILEMIDSIISILGS